MAIPNFTDPMEDGRAVASYATYYEAQKAIDYLSDNGFPVKHTEIVGHDLSLIEKVTGRMTVLRATLAGALTGAWWGLFIAVIIDIFTAGVAWWQVIVAGIAIGGIWGGIFGLIAQSAVRGQRDFSSFQELVATRYDVVVMDRFAQRARRMLGR